MAFKRQSLNSSLEMSRARNLHIFGKFKRIFFIATRMLCQQARAGRPEAFRMGTEAALSLRSDPGAQTAGVHITTAARRT